MADSDIPFYTREKVYDDEIAPLMSKIIDVCRKHNIPMVASYQYENTEEEGAGFCTTILVGSPSKTEKFPAAESLLRAAEILKPRKATTLAITITSDKVSVQKIE